MVMYLYLDGGGGREKEEGGGENVPALPLPLTEASSHRS